jgi:uncharacterized membrane protein
VRRSQIDLGVTAAVAVLACVAGAAGAPVAVMTVLGLLLFAAPGYLLGQLLLGPYIAGLERVAVSAGLAFCVPILGGLALYVARVPLHRAGWLGLLAGVTLICDVVLFVRREGGPLGSLRAGWRVPRGRAAAFTAAVVMAICALGIARVGVAMQHYPGYTQLWLDRPNSKAKTVDLGVGNYEGATVQYQLKIWDNGKLVSTRDLTLADGQVWQLWPRYSDRYSISVNLFRLPDLTKPYRYAALAATETP